MNVKTYKKIIYLESCPSDFDFRKKYPLLIHLHGAGGRGTDINLLKTAGPVKEIQNGRELPCIVVAPQCYADTWFEIFEQLLDFVDFIAKGDDVDNARIYLSGVSMGAYAAWQLAMTKNETFAALVPVCGGGMYWNAAKLKHIPIWAFHGAKDKTVFSAESISMVNKINEIGGNAKLTIYPETEHNCWDETFSSNELYNWIFNQRKD